MFKRTAIMCATVGVLIVGIAKADGNRLDKQKDKAEIRQDQKRVVAARSILQKLSYTIDLWHDANLKGDNKRIYKFHSQLSKILKDDIRSTSDQVGRCENDANSSVREFSRGHRKWSERVDDRRDMKDDRSDLKRARETLKIKQRVMASFVKSPTFSGKYRLLGDYIEIVRRELGMTRVELVGDVEWLREDQ